MQISSNCSAAQTPWNLLWGRLWANMSEGKKVKEPAHLLYANENKKVEHYKGLYVSQSLLDVLMQRWDTLATFSKFHLKFSDYPKIWSAVIFPKSAPPISKLFQGEILEIAEIEKEKKKKRSISPTPIIHPCKAFQIVSSCERHSFSPQCVAISHILNALGDSWDDRRGTDSGSVDVWVYELSRSEPKWRLSCQKTVCNMRWDEGQSLRAGERLQSRTGLQDSKVSPRLPRANTQWPSAIMKSNDGLTRAYQEPQHIAKFVQPPPARPPIQCLLEFFYRDLRILLSWPEKHTCHLYCSLC